MHDFQLESGDEIASTTTTTTTDADTATAAETDTSADTDTQSGSKQREAVDAGKNAERGQAREVGSSESAPAWYDTGGSESHRRLLLIGLDGAAPELALGAWRADLRALALLSGRGVYGRLQSGPPWAGVNAWLSLFTGLDAGQLGVYGAEQRRNHSYAAPTPLDSRAVRAARLWDTLSRADYRVGVVGAPLTTPATPLNGRMVGDASSAEQVVAYPSSFGQQLAGWLADEPATAIVQGDALDRLIGAAYARSEQRFRLARRMLARESYDAFVLCDDGIATVQRALWHTLDVTHMRYIPHHTFAAAISTFYRFVDDQVAELLEVVDNDTVIALVSACGAQALDGELALNDWLIGEGELRLLGQPDASGTLDLDTVDWPNTRAWAGSNGALYLNLAGREPQGAVAPEQAQALLASLAERIAALRPPTAVPLEGPTFEAYRPAALYAATQGVAPDLQVLGVRPGWRASSGVGQRATWLTARADPLDAAYESQRGLVAIYDPRHPGGGRELEGATIYDILPSLLALFGLKPPPRARGQALSVIPR